MRLIIFLSLAIFISCGPQKKGPTYGKTTVQELLSLKGEPIKEEVIPVDDSKVLHFENNEKYQVKNDIVTNGYLNPVQEQKSLIHWKHAFKDCDVVIQKITEKVNGHEPPEYLMKCDAMGVGVVYVQDSDIVLRVVEYEAK
ncbi:MAG TPA: hypothetical protein VKY27_04225 [Bacteriovoracaceae bacterium]|nr:hypothetical protein [Bacteriovoracaceae bacterium]